jgi:hypothetical protein
MITELGIILETPGHYRGDDRRMREAALSELRHSMIAGLSVAFVSDSGDKGARVPDFGHDIRCHCPNPEPYGVMRYFDITLYVEGDAQHIDVMRRYRLRCGAQIDVCQIATPATNGRHELQEVTL